MPQGVYLIIIPHNRRPGQNQRGAEGEQIELPNRLEFRAWIESDNFIVTETGNVNCETEVSEEQSGSGSIRADPGKSTQIEYGAEEFLLGVLVHFN